MTYARQKRDMKDTHTILESFPSALLKYICQTILKWCISSRGLIEGTGHLNKSRVATDHMSHLAKTPVTRVVNKDFIPLRDTPSHQGKRLCKVIAKSCRACGS